MNIETILVQYDFNLNYAKALVQDLTAKQMTTVPVTGLENHPTWTLGHLVSASAMLEADLGGKFQMPENWAELFMSTGPGDTRIHTKDIGKYPSKDLIVEELTNQHNRVKELLRSIDINKLNGKFEWRFSSYMQSFLDVVVFFCISHEAMHLGQISAWRRSMGLQSALARL